MQERKSGGDTVCQRPQKHPLKFTFRTMRAFKSPPTGNAARIERLKLIICGENCAIREPQQSVFKIREQRKRRIVQFAAQNINFNQPLMYWPPLVAKVAPFIYPASVTKKVTRRAISSGSPMRPAGIWEITAFKTSGFIADVMSVVT